MEGSSIDYSDNLLTEEGHYANDEDEESMKEKSPLVWPLH